MKYLFTSLVCLTTLYLFSQPANDNCSGVINLGITPSCQPTLYNNVGATASNIGFDNFPVCFVGNPNRDVWFSFIASDTILDYQISVTGKPNTAQGIGAIKNPQIAVYRGDCVFNGLQLLDCASAKEGETSLAISLTGLTPGIPYYLRINDWSSSANPNAGAFDLCIIKKPPITTIDQGSSNQCSGTLTDTGGPDGNYGNNESHVFTICPSIPHNCINFTLDYYNLETSGFFFFGDKLIFYDGPNTNSPVISMLDGSNSTNPSFGGVCYAVTASSGCLTVQFISDQTNNFEGFLGHWECTADACQTKQAIDIDTNASPEEIVQSVVGGQTIINVTNIDCTNGALGTFSAGDNSDLGLKKGLLLTTGSAANASEKGEFQSSIGLGALGDDDLDYLSAVNGNSSPSLDACVVEMDVFAATDEITFEYVFGSEEYPEYVNTNYNDIFAFLVSGPGIAGDPNIGNQENIATLPDGTFIQINSLNDGANWPYYRDNSKGQSVVYDGLTSDSLGIKKSLTARVATVPCNTYKLKLAIADRFDNIFDSGIFISEIKGGSPNLAINYKSGIEYLVEECTVVPDELNISLNAPVTSPTTYKVIIGGSAQIGVDYKLSIPSSITFQTGNEVFTFPIEALEDGTIEGIENIEIKLVRDFGCGEVVLSTLLIELHDNLQVEILDGKKDTVLVCGGSCAQLNASGADKYFWQPPGLVSDPNVANPTVCPENSQWVAVTGTLGLCSDMDSLWLQVIDPFVQILPDTDYINVCATDTVVLFASNNVNNNNLKWEAFYVNIPYPDSQEIAVTKPFFGSTAFLEVSVELNGCKAIDNITINFDPFDFPKVLKDTTICQDYSVDLGEDISNSTTKFEWTPNQYLSPDNLQSGPVATPEETTTYKLVATSATGTCKDSTELTIQVIEADIEIQNPDTTYLCVGDSVTIQATTSTGGVGVTWSPQAYLNQVTPEQVIVYPPVSTWYYATLVTAECTVVDSVLVYVDSLPELSIKAVPEKASYCQGEEVKLITETYEPANFPDIQFNWENPLSGAQTPDSFLNLVILALETNTYVRTTRVHACTSRDSIHIIVVPVANMSINPATSTVCQGESVNFTITADPGVTDFSWSPPTGLSCTNCPNPTATPPITTTYNVEAKFQGCPVGASASITVTPGPQFDFPDRTDICPGESVLLNGFKDPNSTYSWTSSDGSLTTTDAQPNVSPTQTTTYFLTAKRDDCEVTDQITINIAQDYTLTVSDDMIVCNNALVTLTASASQSSVSFYWTDADGNPVSPPFIAGAGGTYFLSALDAGGCYPKQASVTVDVYPDFMLTASADTTIVSGESVTLKASADLPGVTFEWKDATGAVLGTGAALTLSICGTQTFIVTGVDPQGCYNHSEQVIVSVVQGFSIDDLVIVESDTTTGVYEGEEFSLNVITTPETIPGATYEWYLADELIATTTTPGSGPLRAPEIDAESQTLAYKVVIKDASGCSTSRSVDVIVNNNPVDIPNVFSPNSDNLNDKFAIVSKAPVTVLEFKVWNRWGQLVYDNKDGAASWDGNQNGDPAASDVYVFRIVWEITGGNGKQHVEKGDVTLLR
jgi:gliding motility-associated-like protein